MAGLSMILDPVFGDPLPSLHHVPGGTIMEDSFLANQNPDSGVAGSTFGPTARLRSGAGYQTYMHERQHIRQFYRGVTAYPDLTGHMPYETDAELHSGTNSYLTWSLLRLGGFISREQMAYILDQDVINNWHLKRGYKYIMARFIWQQWEQKHQFGLH